MIVVVPVALVAIGALIQARVSRGWDMVVNLGGGVLILILGMTLADKLMSERSDGR